MLFCIKMKLAVYRYASLCLYSPSRLGISLVFTVISLFVISMSEAKFSFPVEEVDIFSAVHELSLSNCHRSGSAK